MKTVIAITRDMVNAGPQTARPGKVAPPQCPHLGPPIERDGITVKEKCGCSGREQEQPHAAHECALHNRCLPTLRPVDKQKWLERPEAAIYRACALCPDNPSNIATNSRE
jgi:hypothetical protein